jgi:hypothetical protein
MPHPFGFCGRPGGIAWPRTRQYTESDLDASNVFVTSRRQAKIMDFELAGVRHEHLPPGGDYVSIDVRV